MMSIQQTQLIKLLIVCTAFGILSACGDSERQKNIEEREKTVIRKEQELKLWEHRLKLREEALDKQEEEADSLAQDTLGFYNPSLPGEWLVKMRCTETSCETSAIGDTRTEKWQIAYENNVVIVKALSNNKITRLYSGLYNGQNLQLKAQNATTETDIKVVLALTGPNRMEGERQILQSGNCKITYALTLEKL